MNLEEIRIHRHRYEKRWKTEFAERLRELTEGRGIPLETVAETLECDEARVRALLDGKEYPTVVELLRLAYLSYDADDVLFGARERGLYYLLHGRFF